MPEYVQRGCASCALIAPCNPSHSTPGAAAGGDYDSDDELAGKRKDVEALAALEHDGIAYSEFNKDFYEEAPAVAAMTPAQVRARARPPPSPPRPCRCPVRLTSTDVSWACA